MNPYGAYSQAKIQVDEEDKGQILVKVLTSLPEKIDLVKALIEQKKYDRKYEELSRITTIVEILNASLDLSLGEIPRNLSNLYVYVIQRLREVHVTLNPGTLDHCKEILANIAEGFEAAYREERKKTPKAVDPRTL